MALRKSRRHGAASASADSAEGEEGAAAAAPNSVESGDAALRRAGEALRKRAPLTLTWADMASPAWLHALVQPVESPDGDPVWDDRPADPVVVHSDLLWYQLSRSLQLHPTLDGWSQGTGVSDHTSRWRLLGLRCAGVRSHLELSDRELMEAVYRSVTAEDGTLRRLLGIAEVVHGGMGGRLERGAGPVDEAACDRGQALDEKALLGDSMVCGRASGRGKRRKRSRELGDAVRGTMWAVDVLHYLGSLGLGAQLPADAFLAREDDLAMPKIEMEQRDMAARLRAAMVAEGKAVPLDGGWEEGGGGAGGGAEAVGSAEGAAARTVRRRGDRD